MTLIKYKDLSNVYFAQLALLWLITFLLIPNNVLASENPYPGKLVGIGTHRLHIHCVGEGGPTVIIDSGIGGFSLEWEQIQTELSKNVKVCTYDRAGYGWSDPGPFPRTTARISNELRRLLFEARIPGPYLLVGHSFGGYNTRYFASSYPKLVMGLILIDSSHPEQFNTEEFKRDKVKKELDITDYARILKTRRIQPVVKGYPDKNKRLAYMLMSSLKAKIAMLDETQNMLISSKQVARHTNHTPYKFPVVILTRGKRVWPHDEMGNRRELQWLRLQTDLTNISLLTKHFLADKSGHIIHQDQPDLVASNISETVKDVRMLGL